MFSASPSMVDCWMRRPSAGLAAAQRAGSWMSPISLTEYSNHAVRLAVPSSAPVRMRRNTVPSAFSSGGVPRYSVCGFRLAEIAGRNDACCVSSSSCASSKISRSPCWPRPPLRVRARNLMRAPDFRMICSRPMAVLISATCRRSFGPSKKSRISSNVSVAVFCRCAV